MASRPCCVPGSPGSAGSVPFPEATTYVYDKSGSMNAQDGCYDDQLMSYMIAQEMRARMPARIVKT